MNRRVFRKRFRIWKKHGQRRIICTTSWTAAVRFVSSERFTEARPWCREWFGHLLDQITARCVGFTSRFTGRATAADALMVLLEDEVSKFCCCVPSSRIWENKTSLQVCVCVCVCVSVCVLGLAHHGLHGLNACMPSIIGLNCWGSLTPCHMLPRGSSRWHAVLTATCDEMYPRCILMHLHAAAERGRLVRTAETLNTHRRRQPTVVICNRVNEVCRVHQCGCKKEIQNVFIQLSEVKKGLFVLLGSYMIKHNITHMNIILK